MAGDRRGKRMVPNQQADLNVPVEGSPGQVCRGHEDRLVVRHDGLGMEHPPGPFEVKRARVEEYTRVRQAGPIRLPETLRKPADELFGGSRIASFALNV